MQSRYLIVKYSKTWYINKRYAAIFIAPSFSPISSGLWLRKGAIVFTNETPRSSIPSPRSIFASLFASPRGAPVSLIVSFLCLSLLLSFFFSFLSSSLCPIHRTTVLCFSPISPLFSVSPSFSFSSRSFLENRYLKQWDPVSFLQEKTITFSEKEKRLIRMKFALIVRWNNFIF